MTVRQTRRTDIDFRTTAAHPRGIGGVVCSTLVVCSDCGVGNYALAANMSRPSPWECMICGHGVRYGDIQPNLDPGESLGSLGDETVGPILMTVDVLVDRDSIDTRPTDA